MRILHVVVSLDPAHGGLAAVASRLAAAQAGVPGARHEVRIASRREPESQGAIDASMRSIPQIAKVKLEFFSGLVRFGMWVPADVRGQLHRLVGEHDVVHLHGVWDPAIRAAAMEALRQRKPYVITPHGMLDPWSLAQRRLKKFLALKLGYRSMLNQASFLHLLNDDEASLIAPLQLTAPARVIPNGVFLEEIEPLPAPGSFHALRPELKGQPFVLFLSRLHYKKGLDYLADSFAAIAPRHPWLRLVVAGPDGGARADFANRIHQARLADRVHLVGPLYGSQKYAAIVDAACFCLPSRQEGFSVAIIEALACGCPVIISESCHFPEVAVAGAGEVVPLDCGAFAAALDRVVSDPQRRAAMGKAGRELVRSRYTWPRIAEIALDAYAAVVRQPNPVP